MRFQPPPGFGPPREPDNTAPPDIRRFQPPPGYGSPAPGIPAAGGPGFGVQTNTMAITSLVTGILSIPLHFCCYLGWPAGIVAIVLGVISLSQIAKDPMRQSGKGFAYGGIVSAVLGFLAILAIFVAYGAAAILMSP